MNLVICCPFCLICCEIVVTDAAVEFKLALWVITSVVVLLRQCILIMFFRVMVQLSQQ